MSNNVPNSGSASFSDVRTAFEGSGAISIADSQPRLMSNVSSGAISMNDLRGTFHATSERSTFMSGIYWLYNLYYRDTSNFVTDTFSNQPNAQNYALINGKNILGAYGNPADKFNNASFIIQIEGSSNTNWTYLNCGGEIYYRSNASSSANTTIHNTPATQYAYTGNNVLGFPSGTITCYGG